MSVNDFMVGDIAMLRCWRDYIDENGCYQQDNHTATIKMIAVGEGGNCLDEEDYNYEIIDGYTMYDDSISLEPMPLTEEFLNANDFVVNDGLAYKYRCGVYLLHIHYKIGEIEIYEEKGHWTSAYVCRGIKFDSLEYVHQLQQALRLLGLKDLADNFKTN